MTFDTLALQMANNETDRIEEKNKKRSNSLTSLGRFQNTSISISNFSATYFIFPPSTDTLTIAYTMENSTQHTGNGFLVC